MGDTIYLNSGIWNSSKIKKFQKLIDNKLAVLYLVYLWMWCDKNNSLDIREVDPETIKKASEWPGDAHIFKSALIESGLSTCDRRLWRAHNDAPKKVFDPKKYFDSIKL